MSARVDDQLAVLVKEGVDKHIGEYIRWFFKEKAGRLRFNFGIISRLDMIDEFKEANQQLFTRDTFKKRSRERLLKVGADLERKLKAGEELTKTEMEILTNYRRLK